MFYEVSISLIWKAKIIQVKKKKKRTTAGHCPSYKNSKQNFSKYNSTVYKIDKISQLIEAYPITIRLFSDLKINVIHHINISRKETVLSS